MVWEILHIIRRNTVSWDIHQQKNQRNDRVHSSVLKRKINCILQRRYTVALLGSMCSAVMQSHRLNISIAMMAMVNIISTMRDNQDNNATEECPAYNNVSFHEQGIKHPAIFVLMSKWFPRNERGVLCTFIYNGFAIGVAITGLTGGKLCDLEFIGGWPLIFYLFGLANTALAVIFMVFYYDSPEEDPRISDAELKHIQNNTEKNDFSESPPIPWLRIFLSVPFLALVAALFGGYWMNYYFISVHPIYLGAILNIPIKENGILSATPFIFQAIAGCLTCYFCYENKRFTVDTLRRGVNSFSFLLFITGVLGIYFAECNILLNELFSHIAVFGSGFAFGGCFISAVDMSPTFCGPLMGVASTLGCLSGFLAPIVVGLLTNVEQNLTQWGKVFFTGIGICFGSGLIFQLFGSVKIQPYDPASRKFSKVSKTEQKGKESEGVFTLSRL